MLKGKCKLKILSFIILFTALIFFGCADSGGASLGDGGGNGGAEIPGAEAAADATERKIISAYGCTIYTDDLDKSIRLIYDALALCPGSYTEDMRKDADENGGAASLTLRIKTEYYAKFKEALPDAGTVRSVSETSKDVTSQYVDLEARLKAKQSEIDRLEEMRAKPLSLNEQINISDRITKVQTEIEAIMSSIKSYDSLVELCTVKINITQSKPPAEKPGFGQKLGGVLKSSGEAVAAFFEYLLYFLIYVVPFALIAGAVAVPSVILYRKYKRKNRSPQNKTNRGGDEN